MTKALEITDLHKTYRNGVQALCGINLEVKQGDFLLYWDPMVQESLLLLELSPH